MNIQNVQKNHNNNNKRIDENKMLKKQKKATQRPNVTNI